jgi:hypothetical protein
MWPIKLDTSFTRLKILKLKNAGFQLPKKERITPTRIFNTFAPLVDIFGVDVSANPNSYPSSKQSKITRRFATTLSTKQQMQMVVSTRAMNETILKVIMISRPGFGYVIML